MHELTYSSMVERIDDDIVSTNIDNTVIILHIKSGKYFSFNDTGSYLWEMLAKRHTVEELIKLLTDRYDCDLAKAGEDVLCFLNKALSSGLVRVVLS